MNIIELAERAGFFIKDNEAYSPSNQEDHELTEFLEKFAALVAAQEREACAKISDDADSYSRFVNQFISIRIRARGQQTPEGGTA